jgi:hypothetical protein
VHYVICGPRMPEQPSTPSCKWRHFFLRARAAVPQTFVGPPYLMARLKFSRNFPLTRYKAGQRAVSRTRLAVSSVNVVFPYPDQNLHAWDRKAQRIRSCTQALDKNFLSKESTPNSKLHTSFGQVICPKKAQQNRSCTQGKAQIDKQTAHTTAGADGLD